MGKETGKALEVEGKTVTGTTAFTPEASEGTVNVEFTFNASALKGKTIVVFEKAYQDGKEVATHEDINDKGQTVTVSDYKSQEGNDNDNLPRTGENSSIILVASGFSIIIIGLFLVFRKKQN